MLSVVAGHEASCLNKYRAREHRTASKQATAEHTSFSLAAAVISLDFLIQYFASLLVGKLLGDDRIHAVEEGLTKRRMDCPDKHPGVVNKKKPWRHVPHPHPVPPEAETTPPTSRREHGTQPEPPCLAFVHRGDPLAASHTRVVPSSDAGAYPPASRQDNGACQKAAVPLQLAPADRPFPGFPPTVRSTSFLFDLWLDSDRTEFMPLFDLRRSSNTFDPLAPFKVLAVMCHPADQVRREKMLAQLHSETGEGTARRRGYSDGEFRKQVETWCRQGSGGRWSPAHTAPAGVQRLSVEPRMVHGRWFRLSCPNGSSRPGRGGRENRMSATGRTAGERCSTPTATILA